LNQDLKKFKINLTVSSRNSCQNPDVCFIVIKIYWMKRSLKLITLLIFSLQACMCVCSVLLALSFLNILCDTNETQRENPFFLCVTLLAHCTASQIKEWRLNIYCPTAHIVRAERPWENVNFTSQVHVNHARALSFGLIWLDCFWQTKLSIALIDSWGELACVYAWLCCVWVKKDYRKRD
jgi:hypothetical protein